MKKTMVSKIDEDGKSDLISDNWPDIYSESVSHVLTLLKNSFNSGVPQRSIYFSYPWVVTKGEENDLLRFGNQVNGIDLLKCDIQADIKEIQRYLEKVGFSVCMDLRNLDNGGPTLKDQITSNIETFDIVVCFLTPVYKAKVENLPDKSDPNRNYVLKHEFDYINKRKKSNVFRFIMVGNNKTSIPDGWEEYLCTKQSDKTKIEKIKFILKKLLVGPDLTAENGEILFERIWSQLDTKSQKSNNSPFFSKKKHHSGEDSVSVYTNELRNVKVARDSTVATIAKNPTVLIDDMSVDGHLKIVTVDAEVDSEKINAVSSLIQNL